MHMHSGCLGAGFRNYREGRDTELALQHCPTCSPARKKRQGKEKGRPARRPVTAPAATGIFLLVPFARRGDFAEETVTLILNACGEEQLVGVSRHKAIAEGQSPKAVNGDGTALTTAKLTVEREWPSNLKPVMLPAPKLPTSKSRENFR